jgi:hypothetical protein
MYRHQRICSACPGSLWHGARVSRRLSRGTRHLVSADLRVAPLPGQEWWYANPPNCRPFKPLASSPTDDTGPALLFKTTTDWYVFGLIPNYCIASNRL